MRQQRVLIISYQSFHRGQGGGTLYASTLAHWAKQSGYDVTLLARSTTGNHEETTIDGIHIVELSGLQVTVTAFARILDKDFGYSNRVSQYLKSRSSDFDIIHLIIPDITSFIPRSLRSRTIVSVIEDFWTKKPTRAQNLFARYQQFQAGIALRNCFCVTLPSEASEKIFEKWFPNQHDHWQVVQDFVDHTLFTPSGPKDPKLSQKILNSSPCIFVPQRAVTAKKVDTVIRALPAVLKDHPAAQVIISGGGPLESALKDLARELGAQDHVHFMGSVGYETEMPKLYRVADLVVITSSSEGAQPSPTASEAMASGRPLIMTTACDTEGVFRGIVPMYEAGDVGALSSEILQLLSQPKKALVDAERARGIILERFSLDKFLKHFDTLYQNVLGMNFVE